MRNLLWKFIALTGVTGVGFMVILQALEGMSVDPLAAKAAGQQAETAAPADQHAADLPLPPLKTKETVAFVESAPAKNAPAPSPAPFPTGNPFAAAVSSGVSQAAATQPAEPDANPFPPVDFPSAFPADRQAIEQTSQTSDASEPLPDLPVFIPKGDPAGEPNLEAFSGNPSGLAETPFAPPPSFPAPSANPTPAVASPMTADDPFGDPPRPPASTPPGEADPIDVPFDPYEPLPQTATSTVPGGIESPMPVKAADSTKQPVVFPEPEPLVAQPQPTPAMAPAPELADTPPAFPSLPNFETESPAPSLEPQPTPAVATQEPTPAVDPFDLNPPKSPAIKTEAEPTNPGRAHVEIPLAPPAADDPLLGPTPAATNIAQESPEPRPIPQGQMPKNEPLPRNLDPLPNLNLPLVQGNDPQSPATEKLATPAPGSDPLDQLTFPNAVPASADNPEHTKPEHHLTFPDPLTPAVSGTPKQTGDSLPVIHPKPLNAEPMSNLPPVSQTPQAAPATSVGDEAPATMLAGQQQPELKIEKIAPPKAALGQPMIYEILVRNVGTSAAHQVVVEDQVPQGTKLTGTIPRGEMADNRLIWRLGVVGPGEEKKIAVRVIPTQEGQIGSVAKVSFVAEVAARTVVAAAKLDLQFTGPKSVVLGDAVTYHFKLANNGSGDASDVFLRNILPEGLNHPDGNDLEYEVGTLKAGETKEIDLTVNASKAGSFTNKAIISAAGGLMKEATAEVSILGERLTITRTGPKRRYVGRTASFQNNVANKSDTKVAPVRVVEVVPAGMDFVEANADGKYDPVTRAVTWSIAELGPNANRLLKLDLVAKTEGPQTSEVIAFDPNGTRAVVKSETTVEGYTALRLDVREYEEPLDVGEEVGLRIVATNRGTTATTGVVVKMTLPAEMEFVSANGPVAFKRDGATLTFNSVDSLKAGQNLEFDLTLKSNKPGDARLGLEIASDQMTNPLSREEGIRILATRP